LAAAFSHTDRPQLENMLGGRFMQACIGSGNDDGDAVKPRALEDASPAELIQLAESLQENVMRGVLGLCGSPRKRKAR